MQDAVKLAAQYGIGGILALVLGFVIYKIGLRLIAAIDEMRKANAEQSKANVEALSSLSKEVQLAIANVHLGLSDALGDLSERIALVEQRVGITHDFEEDEKPTPVERPKIASVPYHITRKKP